METGPIFLLVFCGLAFLAGAPLNGYVFFVTSCRVDATASAMLFLNRALSDFISILCLPLTLSSIFILDVDWARSISSFVTCLHMFSSAFLLTAISVHHCVFAARPEWAQKHHTASLAFSGVLVTWTLSLGFSLRFGGLCTFLPSRASTSINLPVDEGRAKAAIAVQFLAGFLTPLAFILISIFCVVQAAKLRRNQLIPATQPLKILLGLIPTFFLCWLPCHILCFLQLSAAHPQPLLEIGSTFACALPYISSCLNPIFYLTMEDAFLRSRQRTRNPQTIGHSRPAPAV